MNTSISSIIHFPRKKCLLHNSVFLFVDMQLEFLASGRAYALGNIENCITNSLSILETARAHGMTIAHFHSYMDSTFFNQETRFSNPIEGFQPFPNEMVFERDQPSIYSNAAFSAFLESIYSPELFLIGLTGEKSCLSTVVECAHRKQNLTFIQDASASPSIGNLTEVESHDFVSEIISVYAEVITTKELLSIIQRSPRLPGVKNEKRY